MTGADVVVGQDELRLTPHPLQRMGAFAIAALAGVREPERVGGEQFRAVVARMVEDLVATSRVPKGEPGWYLLGVSYVLWPNCALHYAKKRTPEGLAAWRSMPEAGLWPGVPCMLCGRDAVAWFGKGDIPLGASAEHRNTTARGHEGAPLCFPCVSSFHALPYACAAEHGVLHGVHSRDERFMAGVTRAAVRSNLQRMLVKKDLKGGSGFAGLEFSALRALRWWDRRLTTGVQVIQFNNNNQDQQYRVESMSRPLAEWLRSTASDPQRRSGFRYLALAQATAKTSGIRMLAWRAFHEPERVPGRAAEWLRGAAVEAGGVPGAVGWLGPVVRSYLMEVLQVLERDVEHVTAVAGRIADVTGDEAQLKKFAVASRRAGDLKAWMRWQIAGWGSRAGAEGPFVTVSQWRVLFENGNASWSARDLLFVAVFEELARRGQRVDLAAELPDDEDFRSLDAGDEDGPGA